MEIGREKTERKGGLRKAPTPKKTPTPEKMPTKCKTAETQFWSRDIWNPGRCTYVNTTDHKGETCASCY